MSQTVKQLKESRLQIRMAPSDVEGLAAWMREQNFNPRRDTSRFIRALVRGRNTAMFFTDQSLDGLRFHFSNFARVGGLLNQIVHTLNVSRLRFEAGEIPDVTVNKAELDKTLKDLHREVVEVKKLLLQLAAQRAS
ncbi:MAG: hypothetical protein DI585_06020 [Pseudomonas fluorescens]|nr:MAG: hypothetical protein DI585_06020 [Pseudomonas fluorescens]